MKPSQKKQSQNDSAPPKLDNCAQGELPRTHALESEHPARRSLRRQGARESIAVERQILKRSEKLKRLQTKQMNTADDFSRWSHAFLGQLKGSTRNRCNKAKCAC